MDRSGPYDQVLLAIELIGIADSSEVAFYRRLDWTAADSLAGIGGRRGRSDSLRHQQDIDRLLEQRSIVRADIADSIARLDSGFNIFGLEVFRSSDSKFEPTTFGPVDATYRLGPGDQLSLILTGDVEAVHSLDVSREGFVVIPQVGQLFVANMTLEEVENLLYVRLGRVYSGVRRGAGATTRFFVSVARLRSNQIFVLGDVERPGSYMVSSAGTAMTALYAAGGPTANGSMRDIQIKRGGRLVRSLDLYDYLLRGDASGDARLETGDIVFVPPRALRVRILGEVVRPGTYEVKPDETLADLIRAGGGLRADASRRRIEIERIVPVSERLSGTAERITVDVASSDFADGTAGRLPLVAGDIVRVFPVSDDVRGTVTVKGNVWSPGRIGLRPGMTISDAIRRAGGPKPDVYVGQILVTRTRSDSTRTQLRAAFRDTVGNVANDFGLVDGDLIEVFSVVNFRPEQYVAIAGAVRRPGRYPYRVGMTLRDVVLLADGLQAGAYLKEAEIARLPEDRTGTTTAVTMRVPLDSSYLLQHRAYAASVTNGALTTSASEVVLKAYDNVLILQQPNWELQRVVTIEGEVAFPGPYSLETRSDRLVDLIRRAGGFTSEAYPEGAVVTRHKARVGRVAIDVPTALRRPQSPDNLLLLDGDHIFVPQRSFIVRVEGAVNAPNVVAYAPGRGVDYYVKQAGGVARNGDSRHAYVTQPNGKRETKGRFTEPKPLAGSVVVVPVLDPSSRRNLLQTIANVTPLITSIITTYLLVKSIQ